MTTKEAFDFVDEHFTVRKKREDGSPYCVYGYVQQRAELRMLYLYLKSLDPMQRVNFMEIGTAMGGTFALLTTLFPGLRISIDKFFPLGDQEQTGQRIIFNDFAARDAQFRKYCGENIHTIDADSHDPSTLDKVNEILGGKTLNFLMIDGDHTYEGVKKDFEMYSPLVCKGGLIALHDIRPDPGTPQCQVHKYWSEMVAARSGRGMFEFNVQSEKGMGIGVIVNAA